MATSTFTLLLSTDCGTLPIKARFSTNWRANDHSFAVLYRLDRNFTKDHCRYQQTRELLSAGKTSHNHNNKNLCHFSQSEMAGSSI